MFVIERYGPKARKAPATNYKNKIACTVLYTLKLKFEPWLLFNFIFYINYNSDT